MLQTRDLACVRGDRSLFRALDLQIGAGECLRIEGPNGSGKTSLLRLLAGLGLPDAGEVLWQGQPLRRVREAYAASLVYLGHLGGLKEELTPVENLHFAAAAHGWPGVDRARIDGALAHWGLARQAALPLARLSAGQKRRSALARLALAGAALWILDEPFNALDSDATTLLMREIEAQLARGGSVVLTSHLALPLAGARSLALG